MENFNPGKRNEQKKEPVSGKVSNFLKTKLLSKLMDKSKLDENLADNLYANKILEEERIAPNKSYSGFSPALPEGSKIIEIDGSHYLQKDGRMYYMREFEEGFDLVDNTYDFMPRPGELYPSKEKLKYQKKYNVSDTSTPINDHQFYKFNKTKDDLDDWIIHNDKGTIRKDKTGKDNTWWLKGEPYKAMEERSLTKDKPIGRHLFAKQSALEASIGRPLDQHRELTGEIEERGSIKDGGITVTPTSETDLPKIEDLKSFTYNPITKSMEKGIFYDPNKPKDEKEE